MEKDGSGLMLDAFKRATKDERNQYQLHVWIDTDTFFFSSLTF